MDDYYQILKVPRTATLEEIKQAYHQSALRHHPDKQATSRRTNGGHPIMVASFLRIQEAWECLGDSVKRIEYDRTLQQQQESVNRRKRNAIVLTSIDCRWESDNDDEVYYQCRCGFDLALTQLLPLQDDLIACPGCSLVYDTVLLFETN